MPFEFRRLQAVNLADWQPGQTHAGFAALGNRIRSILNEPQKPVPPVPSPDDNGDTASWTEAMSNWGKGRQRGYRIGAAVAGLLGLVSCSEALDYGDGGLLIGSLILAGVAVYLLYLGRRPG